MGNDVRMTLGDLADPEKYSEPVDLSNCGRDRALQYLDRMVEIRTVEEQIADWVTAGKAGTPCHLGIGQEAAAVGIATGLTPADRAFGNHRSHSHYLAMGGDLTALLAEVLGRSTGASKGMGGSMHLYQPDVGFHGSVPIVAATISIAVGAALAQKMDGGSDISVSYFGDGAAEEGVLHESLNLAASQQLPVLFVCENNFFSSHLDIELRQPGNRIARFADAHGVESRTVDGNDVIAVAEVAGQLISGVRDSGFPAFIELVTFRHRGHVGPNEDIDVGVHRTMDDVVAWKRRDPIERLSRAIIASGLAGEDEIEEVRRRVSDRVRAAASAASSAPYPPPEQLTTFVFSGESR